MSVLSVTHRELPDATLLQVAGELDRTSAAELERHLGQIHLQQEESLILDLSALSFLDSNGLRILMRTHERLEQAGRGGLHLAAVQPLVLRLLEITGVGAVLHVHPDLEQAIAAVGQHAQARRSRRPFPIGLILPSDFWTGDFHDGNGTSSAAGPVRQPPSLGGVDVGTAGQDD
ncbi:STAS domain-containing protein [Nonomuraea sp. NN258]|uniref:STAS domain-containing protein n=1 Tax=Nonomuraea antri TaxID=2730852 RepID=UPI001567E3EC|nr:STAS domain-containing protein [Nonomuraea antri]NRQ34525.1 STAS domain-containing protein [Nonomuraea antri]